MKELKNPFALKDNRIITINDLDESDRGLRAGCICPVCKGEFEAKMGDVREHHFAHTGTPCDRTLQYVNSVYMLVEQCLKDEKSFTYPGFIEKGCSVFDGGILKVSDVEIRYKPNGMACGIVINKKALALRLNLKMEYCVGEVKTPLEGLSTILIDLQVVDGLNTSEITALVCHDTKGKSWIYSTRAEKERAKFTNGDCLDIHGAALQKKHKQSDFTIPTATCCVCRKTIDKQDAMWGNNTRRYYCHKCIEEKGLSWRDL